MDLFVAAMLLLGAHFCLTAFAPAKAGKAWLLWPFGADSRPVYAGVGELPNQPGNVITPLLAGVAGLSFIGAVLALFGIVIPSSWLTLLIVIATGASIALFALYFSPRAILPLTIDAFLLVGVLMLHWSAVGLRSP